MESEQPYPISWQQMNLANLDIPPASHVETQLGEAQQVNGPQKVTTDNTQNTGRPFACTHCKKTFVRQYDKRRHENTHTGQKNFECSCGKLFARSDSLTEHKRGKTAGPLCRGLLGKHSRDEGPLSADEWTSLGADTANAPRSFEILRQTENNGLSPWVLSNSSADPRLTWQQRNSHMTLNPMESTLPTNSRRHSRCMFECVYPGCSQHLRGFHDWATHWREVHLRVDKPMATPLTNFSDSSWLSTATLQSPTTFNPLNNTIPYSHLPSPRLPESSAHNQDTFTHSDQSQSSFSVDTVHPSYPARPDSQRGHLADEHSSKVQSNDPWYLAPEDLCYYCSVCPAKHKQPKPFARHLLQHLDDMLEQPYFCSSCNKNSFALFEQLDAHRRYCAALDLFACDRWGCNKVFLSRSSLSTHKTGQDGSICLDHSKQKETDTWDELVKGLLILGPGDFSLPAGIAEGAEPRRSVVVFLEKKIGEWGPSF